MSDIDDGTVDGETKSVTKRLLVGGASYYLQEHELEKLKTWITERRQETAMRFWSQQFDIPMARAVGIINRIQAQIICDCLDCRDVTDEEVQEVAVRKLERVAQADRS